MRTVGQTFTTGKHGSLYLIADVGRLEGLNSVVNSMRVRLICLPGHVLARQGYEDHAMRRGLMWYEG